MSMLTGGVTVNPSSHGWPQRTQQGVTRGEETDAGMHRRRLEPAVSPPADDDVARYGGHQDATFDQLTRPRMRTVPGRF